MCFHLADYLRLSEAHGTIGQFESRMLNVVPEKSNPTAKVDSVAFHRFFTI
jgi:hypothetical protein